MFNNLFKSMFSLILVSILVLTFVSCSDDDSDDNGGDNYYLIATIDGTETTFAGGFTESGNIPIAGYDSEYDCTSIYAFDPSISFYDIYTSGTGIVITDFDDNSAGTCTTCTVQYIINGAISAAPDCTVTIDSYGATVTGSFDSCTAGSHTITDCTFVVKNMGDMD